MSNYGVRHIDQLLASPTTTVVPVVNQIELHPFLTQDDIVKHCAAHKIHVQAYSPVRAVRVFAFPIHPAAARTDVHGVVRRMKACADGSRIIRSFGQLIGSSTTVIGTIVRRVCHVHCGVDTLSLSHRHDVVVVVPIKQRFFTI